MRQIKIYQIGKDFKTLQPTFIVEVVITFQNKEDLIESFTNYLNDPERVEKEYFSRCPEKNYATQESPCPPPTNADIVGTGGSLLKSPARTTIPTGLGFGDSGPRRGNHETTGTIRTQP